MLDQLLVALTDDIQELENGITDIQIPENRVSYSHSKVLEQFSSQKKEMTACFAFLQHP
jgi:hypothetical protein